MILVIDNEDSFVYNLARYFVCQGQLATTVRHDQLTVEAVRSMAPAALVLSPGPGLPTESSFAVRIIREFWQQLPILGVCLGHQQIGVAFGGTVVRAQQPMHGRTSLIHHDGLAEFQHIETPFAATRYHSLVIDERTLPESLMVTARSQDGTLMGVRVRGYPVVGWQFHPESILTEIGVRLISSFLLCAGLSAEQRRLPAAIERDATLISPPHHSPDPNSIAP